MGKCFIAENDDKILGFISIYSQDAKAQISWIAVAQEFHNEGIGTALLNETEKVLKNLGVKTLRVKTVVKQNPPDGSYDLTMRFYKSRGFKIDKKYPQKKHKHYTYNMGILKKIIK